jgi:hypothetical protein
MIQSVPMKPMQLVAMGDDGFDETYAFDCEAVVSACDLQGVRVSYQCQQNGFVE